MKFDKEMMWNVALIISIILIINGMSHSGDTDKKTAQAGQDQTTAGAIGAVISFIGKKQIWGIGAATMPWIVTGISSLLLLIPNFLGNMVDLFRPQPSIPSWVWIGGFVILAFMIIKKK